MPYPPFLDTPSNRARFTASITLLAFAAGPVVVDPTRDVVVALPPKSPHLRALIDALGADAKRQVDALPGDAELLYFRAHGEILAGVLRRLRLGNADTQDALARLAHPAPPGVERAIWVLDDGGIQPVVVEPDADYGVTFYFLLNGQAVPTHDAFAHTSWLDLAAESRTVAVTEVGSLCVSTVFAGVSSHTHPPMNYETAVFGSKEDWAQELSRYHATREEAVEGHAEIVELVRAKLEGGGADS
jgi:hypothetical protein